MSGQVAIASGVYETATGNLLRWGFSVDFENDGSFDPGTETHTTNMPSYPKVVSDPIHDVYSRWNGSSWEEVAKT